MTSLNQAALEDARDALFMRWSGGDYDEAMPLAQAVVRAYLDALPAAPLPEEVERVAAEWTAAMDGVTPGPWTADQSNSRKYLDAVQFSYQSGSKGTVALVGKDEAQVGASETEEQNANSGWIARCSPDGIRSLLALITQQAQALADANARIREMEEALEPFARYAEVYAEAEDGMGRMPDDLELTQAISSPWAIRDMVAVTLGDFRRARRVRGGNNV